MDQYANPDTARKAADRAAPLLAAYAERYGIPEPDDVMISDLITDLLHLADRAYRDETGERDAEGVLARVTSDYDGERVDDGEGYGPPRSHPAWGLT